MRYKLEKYQGGEKHIFTAKMARRGGYINRNTGKNENTILFTNVTDEDGRIVTDHAWVREDSYLRECSLTKGMVYSFEAKVGTYNRGRTAKDYQLNRIRQLKAA